MYGHNTSIATAPSCTNNKVFIEMIHGRSRFEGRFTILFFGKKEREQIGTITNLGSIPPQVSLLANQPTITCDSTTVPITCPEKSALYGDCASGYIRSNYCQRFCMVQELDGNRAKDKYIKLKLVREQIPPNSKSRNMNKTFI